MIVLPKNTFGVFWLIVPPRWESPAFAAPAGFFFFLLETVFDLIHRQLHVFLEPWRLHDFSSYVFVVDIDKFSPQKFPFVEEGICRD